jgi:hypothetical protein
MPRKPDNFRVVSSLRARAGKNLFHNVLDQHLTQALVQNIECWENVSGKNTVYGFIRDRISVLFSLIGAS